MGDWLDATSAADLQRADGRARALAAALEFLAVRPRSEREVRDRLARREFAPQEIDACVARLQELRYLDDREFARYWIDQRQGRRPRGARAIGAELWRKGVDRETSREALEAAAEERDQVELAIRAGEKKARDLRFLEPRERRAKLGQFLARRGFDWETVRGAVRRLCAEEDDETAGRRDSETAGRREEV